MALCGNMLTLVVLTAQHHRTAPPRADGQRWRLRARARALPGSGPHGTSDSDGARLRCGEGDDQGTGDTARVTTRELVTTAMPLVLPLRTRVIVVQSSRRWRRGASKSMKQVEVLDTQWIPMG
jgi:hypothetical protein